jgi:hypothetical protein
MEWGFFVFLWFVSGAVGVVLGAIVEKLGAGFFLGLFLGPVGWIIVFLLPRVVETKEVSIAQNTGPGVRTARPERNLESDDYKLWLSKTYNIQKNDLFEKYEFDVSLFATLDDVLTYVDQKDRDKEAVLDQAQRKAELEQAQRKAELERAQRKAELEQAQRKAELEKTKQVEAEKVAKAAKVFPKF